jgi:hypothetical protein
LSGEISKLTGLKNEIFHAIVTSETKMSKLITSEERIQKASELIQKARDLPIAAQGTFLDLGYVAQVRDLLRQAREMIQFINYSPSTSQELKAKVGHLGEEIKNADRELLHKNSIKSA